MDGKLRNMASLYILHGDDVLMLYRIGSRVVGDSWVGSAGGHFEKDEVHDARACILRELYEETGLHESALHNLSIRYITLRLKNNEVRQNYYFFAQLKDRTINISSNEGKLEWVNLNMLSQLPMPHTATYVMQHYANIGRYTDKLYGGIAVCDDVIFNELEEF